MAIEHLHKEKFAQYDSFLAQFEQSLVYSSSSYLQFLEKQTGATPIYLVSTGNNEINGCLPLFLKESEQGNVLNSLPFYGSNGGVLAKEQPIRQALIEAYQDLIRQHNCLSSTIITSPFESDSRFYRDHLQYQFTDERIGQITTLTGSSDTLMDIFHFKTRNTVRKGLKSGLAISWEDGLDFLDFLFETHKDNISAVGGLWKSKETFMNLVHSFAYGSQLRIYVAKHNGLPVAALLVLYFNKTVEYYTPVTVAAYRNLQPMSALIYTAMCDAVDSGYQWWNWGGTWLSQGGVYDFKARWGTTDYPYYYFTTITDVAKVKQMTREQLLSWYPFFYVIPFSAIS